MKFRDRVQRWLEWVNHYSNRWWYLPFMAFLSALDAYIVIVPNDPLVAAGAFANPRKWIRVAVWMTVGSALGAVSVAWLVSSGSDWILSHLVSEHLRHSHTWIDSLKLIRSHGLWGLALVSLSPFPQHAAVIIAGLVEMSLWDVFIAVFLGRVLKYGAIAYLAAKSPHVLRKWKLLPPEKKKPN